MTFEIQERIRTYFRGKSAEIKAKSIQAISGHTSIQGTHRELIINHLLKELIPKRFAIASGEIHSFLHKSRQTDIIIWDEYNYPNLKLLGNDIFFPESVKFAIEVKSIYSSDEMDDVVLKTQSISQASLVQQHKTTIKEEINNIYHIIESMQTGRVPAGMLIKHQKPGNAAVFFTGGHSVSLSQILEKYGDDIDGNFPDIIYFLECGKIIYKELEWEMDPETQEEKADPKLVLMEAGDDSLLFFSSQLLTELSEKVLNLEKYSYLSDYIEGIFTDYPKQTVSYPMTRMPPGVKFIYEDPPE